MEDHGPLPTNDVFRFAVEARTSLRLRTTTPAHFDLILSEKRRLAMTIESERHDLGYPLPILKATIIVTHDDVISAGAFVTGFVRSFFYCISVATNAYIDDATVIYGVDISATPTGDRQFVQTKSLFDRSALPAQLRLIDYDAAFSFAQNVMDESNKTLSERLGRAIQQYVFAVRYWNLEQQVLSCAHAYMAVEALTPIAKRSLHMSDVDLAQLEVSDKHIKYTRRARDVPNAADARARRSVIFHNDALVARKARTLSDGFEHGYGDYGEMREIARSHAVDIMRHVRHAIIELAGLTEEHRDRLLIAKYDEPMPLFSVFSLRGHFPATVSAEGYAEPPVRMKDTKATVTAYNSESDEYSVNLSNNVGIDASEVFIDEAITRS